MKPSQLNICLKVDVIICHIWQVDEDLSQLIFALPGRAMISVQQPTLIDACVNSLDGGEGGGGITTTGGLGPRPPFSYFWKCQNTSLAGDLLFVVSINAWSHFKIHNDAPTTLQFILEDVVMALDYGNQKMKNNEAILGDDTG